MSRQARIEEVSDSASEASDPSDFDPAEFDPSPIALRKPPPADPKSALLDPSSLPSGADKYASAAEVEKYKSYQTVYPVYFDAGRSRAEGRRVGRALAVQNPLARDIVEAIGNLGLNALFEPGKLHPKDWANPGRVKVLVKADGKAVSPRVKNKHHLYTLISAHLRAHPTTPESALKLRIPNLPPPDPSKPFPTPAVPRGWKLGTILPLHSAALGGGGASDELLKEMMAGMPGMQGLAPALADSGDGEVSRRQEKKMKQKQKVIRG
ncbi:MAG: signal recognition particle subunit [Thelocarpon impressellum]|nr:MAG: signal recognition particle subunit [Thelocarpon impressellum]